MNTPKYRAWDTLVLAIVMATLFSVMAFTYNRSLLSLEDRVDRLEIFIKDK